MLARRSRDILFASVDPTSTYEPLIFAHHVVYTFYPLDVAGCVGTLRLKLNATTNTVDVLELASQAQTQPKTIAVPPSQVPQRLRDDIHVRLDLRRTARYDSGVPYRHVGPGPLLHVRDAPVHGHLDHLVCVRVSEGGSD